MTPMLGSLILYLAALAIGTHHMKREVTARQNGNSIPLVITNQCAETVYPGVVTQAGTGPQNPGFGLQPGDKKSQTVSSNWQGRVWGRTNCTFNSQGNSPSGGPACQTGDCGGTLNCLATGETPVTLAEFTLDGGHDQTFYDISLVDGYNLPMAITIIGNANLPPNQGNPSCVGTVGNLAPTPFNAYQNGPFLDTNASSPLPFDSKVTHSQCSQWCPWDLQKSPPTAPGNGVYPYPDANIQRPAFNPCLSACAKYNKPNYCCTGSYDGPNNCKPSYYSTAAKSICPDAYSFAYDDQTSTFILEKGPGFQVIFCPGGRSTNIKAAASSGSSSSSGGSFRPAFGRTFPILESLAGTNGWALVVAVLSALGSAVAFA